MILGLGMGLLAGPAIADSASFNVGVTIGKKVKPAKSAASVSKLTYTWGAAAISVSEAGYRDIRRQTRDQELYWFTARKGENLFRIAVSASSGAIVEVTPA